MRLRRSLALVMGLFLVLTIQGVGQSAPQGKRPTLRSEEAGLPDGFLPAAVRARQVGRYFVEMKVPSAASVALRARGTAGTSTSAPTQDAAKAAIRSQEGAIGQARSLGGQVIFRYGVLINAFSAKLSAQAAGQLAQRTDVASVQPVGIVRKHLTTSVPFIKAPEVWSTYGVRGEGMRVAVVDTGIDYTHASFGGAGTVAAYDANDPTFIETGTFPTEKVIGGFDFVGENYDVLDAETSNDIPRPDFDPLDEDGHGTHTASTVAGIRVPGQVGRGVAPMAKLYAYKVWDVGNSTDDVLVAAYERAVDPNQDGNVADAVDVLSFSGGVSYGTLNSLEAKAAQRVVDLGTVFVASAGNEGHQAVGGSPYILGTPASARGVVAVGASIDEFVALQLVINSTSDGTIPELPDNGLTVHQDWSADLPPGGITDDLFDGREVDPAEQPADAMFCAPLPGGSLTDQTVLVFKGSTGEGDCDGTTKVFNAQEAGATAVILVSQFGGLPFGLGPGEHVDEITIPAVIDLGRRRRGDPPRAQPERTGHLQRRRGQRHDQRRAGDHPGLRRRVHGLLVRGPGSVDERPEARHLRTRVQHRRRRGGNRERGDRALGHLDGGSACLGRRHAAQTAPSEVEPGPDQGRDDEPSEPQHEEQRPDHAGVGHPDGLRTCRRIPVRSRPIGGVARQPVVRVRTDTDGVERGPELPGQ